jgi:hypothetical protein
MGRNTREIRGWTEEKVEGCTVAPHRYTWSREAPEDDLAEPGSGPIREWKAKLPYQPGEIMWVNRNGKPIRARILTVVVDYDRYGDRRPAYQCQTETAKGVWSKVWTRFYPGGVQRGYLLAGLAPDLVGMID